MIPIAEGTGLSGVLGILFPGATGEEKFEPPVCTNPDCKSADPKDHKLLKWGEAGWHNTKYLCTKCNQPFEAIMY